MIATLGLNTGAPYHLFLYSIALGGSVFHSFVVSPLAFKHLPREEFGKLQNKVFPTYFIGQAVVPLVLGLTSPFRLCPFSTGVLAISGIAGALNYFVLLPICRNIKQQRDELVANKLHETIEGGEVKASDKYTELNKKFGKYHGISSVLNLLSIASLAVYGTVMAKRLTR
ncbi:putative mitochondrial outer membrane protein [Meyerozyma sp. JA9]|nr:putative mitochondrial outer membrane protein [Meyerozyma sp. JA9]